MNYQDIVFKECPVHPMMRYAGDKCPVCAAIEAHDLELGRMEEDMVNLEGHIADLEQQIESGET